ncbi:hypothetical protein RND81_07G183800 [Saponaria officinalis]|uniref:Uncharacterized protein n=1 Tax=Saponaria officinalis TaxID=3572 RepID=A0AAW1JPV4_SAPOF
MSYPCRRETSGTPTKSPSPANLLARVLRHHHRVPFTPPLRFPMKRITTTTTMLMLLAYACSKFDWDPFDEMRARLRGHGENDEWYYDPNTEEEKDDSEDEDEDETDDDDDDEEEEVDKEEESEYEEFMEEFRKDFNMKDDADDDGGGDGDGAGDAGGANNADDDDVYGPNWRYQG